MIPIDRSKQLRRLLAEGKTLDQAFAELRNQGASMFDCVAAVKAFRQCNVGEAKRIVWESKAWSDVAQRTEKAFSDLNED